MNRVDEFIEEYKKLEESTRRVYKLTRDQSIVSELKRQPGFAHLKSEIQSCADLRNFFQHNSRLDGNFAAEPTEATIAFVRELVAMVNNRPRCRDICVRKRDIIWRGLNDSVKDAMQLMKEQGHSCIPILQDGRVVGVFDERALFDYVTQSSGDLFKKDGTLTFKEILPFISVAQRNMETFAFAGMNAFADDAAELFEKKLENGKRIRLVLLTNSGKAADRLQGIITPWDILAAVGSRDAGE